MQQITAHELKARLEGEGTKPVVLDVREPWEVNVVALPGAKHIPMAQVPLRLSELDREAEIVVLCHHGVRSMQVAYFLERQGYKNLLNLRGGINAWAQDIDPSMPRY